MKLRVAIDTATPFGTVAAGTSQGPLAEVSIGHRRHAAAALPAVEEVLRLAGAQLADVDEIVLADGPGSFTGLRIGFATVKGLLHEHPGISLRLAPSLLALAWGAKGFAAGPIAALYDALRGDVFAAVYRFADGRLDTLVAPVLIAPAELVRTGPRPAIAIGYGAVAHAARMLEWTGRPPVGPPAAVPRASALLELPDLPGAAPLVEHPESVEPNYGRLAEAQARWERAHGRPLGEGQKGQEGQNGQLSHPPRSAG